MFFARSTEKGTYRTLESKEYEFSPRRKEPFLISING